jgi:hypothetical protein
MFLIEWGDKPALPPPPSTPFASNTPKMLKKLLDFAVKQFLEEKVFSKTVRNIESRKILRDIANLTKS